MAQTKESKTKVKLRDLKPMKDAKGGMIANNANNANNQTRQQNNSLQRGANQSSQQTRFI
jgi:hypothetical protein